MQPNGTITLLTDFGLRDGYVAVMKGVILGIAPQVRLVDITHEIMPQAIGEASYVLQSAYRYFPPGTIHVVVVDPGVGSQRRAIAVATPDACFVAPDNGVLAPVIDEVRARSGGGVQVVELTERRFWLPEISATFHGRDIFAPVAAHLLCGTELQMLGRPLDRIEPAVMAAPQPQGPATLEGQILHVDRFGNCITNITVSDLEEYGIGRKLSVEIAGDRVSGLYPTYSMGPIGIPMALISSSGHLEVAVCNGNAAKALGVTGGDRLRVTPERPR
jgi:S-adenosylmethionine hydrolase